MSGLARSHEPDDLSGFMVIRSAGMTKHPDSQLKQNPVLAEACHRLPSQLTFSSFCRQRTTFGIGVSGKLVFQFVTPTSPT
jgi:hypothetical protein